MTADVTDPQPTEATAEGLVAAIWERWTRDLEDWDLGGSTANRQARALAVEAVTGTVDALNEKTANLRAGLHEQWLMNHAEHCSNEWPHPDGKRCYWPV